MEHWLQCRACWRFLRICKILKRERKKTWGKSRVAHCTAHSDGGIVLSVDGFSEMVDGFPKYRKIRGKTSPKWLSVGGRFLWNGGRFPGSNHREWEIYLVVLSGTLELGLLRELVRALFGSSIVSCVSPLDLPDPAGNYINVIKCLQFVSYGTSEMIASALM